jgi:hypothetical protein
MAFRSSRSAFLFEIAKQRDALLLGSTDVQQDVQWMLHRALARIRS